MLSDDDRSMTIQHAGRGAGNLAIVGAVASVILALLHPGSQARTFSDFVV
jgi:hypothetical protein